MSATASAQPSETRRDDEPDRKQIARPLVGLRDRDRIPGRNAGTKARNRAASAPVDIGFRR